MTTLANVTRETRIILKLAAASLVVATAFFIFFRGGAIIKNILLPSPPPPPEEKFGKLPRVKFPAQNSSSIEYRINTLTGKLPSFPEACVIYKGTFFCQMKVYKFKRNPPSLVALQAARNNLSSTSYSKDETKISESVYQWSNNQGNRIQLDIITNQFKITSGFLIETPPQGLRGVASKKDGAFKTAVDFLVNINEDISDLDQDKSQAIYLKILDGKLVAAESLADAQFMRLDIFQKNVEDNYEIYYPGVTQSTMYFIFSNEEGTPRIVEGGFSHFMPDPNAVSTYPIKNATEAFEDLKKGNAYIINNNAKDSSIIDITEVNLGYYVGDTNQQYLLPIIIFKGKNFTAYVQAIPDSSIGN